MSFEIKVISNELVARQGKAKQGKAKQGKARPLIRQSALSVHSGMTSELVAHARNTFNALYAPGKQQGSP